jgi:hypothetical protein
MHDDTSAPAHPVPRAGPLRRQRRRYPLPVAAALLGLAFVAAACSSDPSTPGVAGSGTTPTTGASSNNAPSSGVDAAERAGELAYSQCMRSHGVPNFPDPNSQGAISIQGGSTNGASSNGLDPNSPSFQKAQRDCQSKLPQPTKAQQAQALQHALQQARCMRNHGIKDFPDPQSAGGKISLSINGSAGSDLNPNDPLFQAAQKACMPNAPKPPSGGNGRVGTGSGGNAGFQLGGS